MEIEQRASAASRIAPAVHVGRSSGHAEVNAETLLEAYLAALESWRMRWRTDGFAPVRAAWLERAAALKDTITVSLPNITKRGVFEGLDETGALLLNVDGDGTLRIDAGDVLLTQGGV